ncbi:MAG: class I SAM-dependent methyltransferase [Candidatus Methanofastidiosia archaeon]
MDVVQQTVKTYDKIASEYCRKTRLAKFLEWEENYIRKLLIFISKSTPLILDVGCGDGRHCVLIEKNGGKIIGIDLSKSMLKEAKAYYLDGDFRKMDMRRLLFDDDFFDGIWASGCIYHVTKSDVRKVIKEFRRVLKIDGIVGLSFKLGKGEGLEDNPKSYAGSPRYFAYYTKREMKDIFKDFGFEELESCIYPEEIFGYNIQQMWFKLRSK